jgi:hypothetical protein
VSFGRGIIAFLGSAALAAASASEPPRDPLADNFLEPPQEARPLVYWQWVNGNVTHEGIRLDLEWMQRVGIGGALLFDIGFRTPPVPQYVEHRVGFGTPEWERALRFAATETKRLGLDFGAQSSGGWSVSGGPGVAPGQAMKKLVWSETLLTPAMAAPQRLSTPPSISGPYQDVPIAEPFREPALYEDVAVIAFPLPEAELSARPILSGAADVSVLDDGRYATATGLTPVADGTATLDARFDEAAPLAVTLAVRGALPKGVIEASADGARFESIVEFPGDVPQPAPVHTFALPQRTEKFWRIRFRELTAPLAITEARFEFGARVDRGPEKAAFGVLARNENTSTNASTRDGGAIPMHDIIDVTAHRAPDGTLSWRPPRGTWIAVRFGWSLTGRRSVPATNESIGLEVDKLDAAAVRSFAAAHYDRHLRASGGMNLAITDSWEAGQQNWTPAMLQQFATRRGYDMRAWMPVLTGRVVGDAARSERFLADFRRTIADLLADNHYGVLAQVARERGMKLYAEAAGTDLPTVIDGMQAKGRVDVPMAEYWYYPEDGVPKPNHIADVREAASAAHLYGRRIVAAEAFTTMGEEPWATGPAQLRRIADRFFAEGINRIVLHTSAHQPFTDRRPGITLRQYGQHLTRNETWAEDAGAWVRYLARTSYLLQQGQPVADVAVFLGEDAAVSPPFHGPGEPQRWAGYDLDFVNAEALLTRISVREGRLTLRDGGSYRVLIVPPHIRRMSLPVIEKLRTLVAGGAVLVGPKPVGATGLTDSDQRVLRVADEIWGRKPQALVRKFGLGRVYAGPDVLDVLSQEKISPDVDISGAHDLQWAHRATKEADIYFIANPSARAFGGEIRLRAAGRRAQWWDAVDGSRSLIDHSVGGRSTTVRVELAPRSSGFIVLRGSAPAGKFAVEPRAREVLAQLDGAWDVKFLDGQGAPENTQLAAGVSWTENSNPAIRYYSGRAQYSRTVAIPPAWLTHGRRIELDLGAVAELARVRINGRDLGVLWNVPFHLDITEALRAGDNRLEIVVTNYWANRFIGDEQPGATRHTFAPIRPYTAATPLRRSGLLTEVRLMGTEGFR